MTACPELHEIISFAENPENGGHAELAGHIWGCETCQTMLGACMDAEEVAPLPEITVGEEQQARHLVCEVLDGVSVWHRFQTAMTRWLSSGLEALFGLGTQEEPERECDFQPAFAASLHGGATAEDSPVFEFCSVACNDSAHAWKASMTLPPVMMDVAELVFIVTDGRQRPIVSGEFVFQGVALPVMNGVAKMSVEAFQKSLAGAHMVQMRFADGVCVDGDIRLMEA